MKLFVPQWQVGQQSSTVLHLSSVPSGQVGVSMRWQDVFVCWMNTSSLTWTHWLHTHLSWGDTHCSPTCTHVELKRMSFTCKYRPRVGGKDCKHSPVSYVLLPHSWIYGSDRSNRPLSESMWFPAHTKSMWNHNLPPRACCAWFITACYCKRKRICAFHQNAIAFLHF